MSDNEGREKDIFSGLAVHDFQRAYQKSFFRAILKKITGKESGLFSFDAIRKSLVIKGETDRGLREVEIDKIIGSLSRYDEFDESFLLRQTFTRNRWQAIDKALMSGEYLPPVELYKISDFFFVIDGNHRVSVAKEKGQKFIDAHVRELEIPFQISGEFNWESVLLKQGRINFFKNTRLNELRPDIGINLTIPGQYHKLLEHIDVHRYYLSQMQQREIPYQDALLSWVDNIYTPMIDVIRDQKILDHFPNRSESDLYVWIIEHLAYIQYRYPSGIGFREAAADFLHKRKSLLEKIREFLKH
ncbi:MAG: hypothetical protein FJZ98_02350 [Chloroflexi bacterium]|nr:hypothetical protein [Chloroflexota bacterium]